MTRLLPLIAILLAYSLPAADDPIAKGRALYEAARKAASSAPLHDIAYERTSYFDRQGRKLQVQSSIKVVLPDVSRTEVISPGGRTIFVFDGTAVTNRSTGQALPQDAADLQRRELARTFVLFGPLPAEGSVRYRGQEDVDGRAAEVIEISDIGDTPLRLFLDPETHDVLKRMYVGDAPDGAMSQVEEFLSDYKTIDGVRWPHSMRTMRNGQAGPSSTMMNVTVNKGLSKTVIIQ